jgi:hypothetical protein
MKAPVPAQLPQTSAADAALAEVYAILRAAAQRAETQKGAPASSPERPEAHGVAVHELSKD